MQSMLLNSQISILDYEKYIEESLQFHNHSHQKFIELRDRFDLNILKNNKIKLRRIDNKIFVDDGCHRIAILMSMYGSVNLPTEYFEPLNFKLISKSEISLKRYRYFLLLLLKIRPKRKILSRWSISKKFPAGYHSLNTFDLNIQGQRNCSKRIELIEKYINLDSKTVLDLGCNTGQMIMSLRNPKYAVGIDYDIYSIWFAKILRKLISRQNYEYAKRIKLIRLNLNKVDQVRKIINKQYINIDIIFLFSLGSWINKWKELYTYAVELNCDIILETNNDKEGIDQINFFKSYSNREIQIISNNSMDDSSGNYGRKTYLIKKK